MRLVLVFLVAVILAAVAALFQNSSVPRNDHRLLSHEQREGVILENQPNRKENDSFREERPDNWNWLWNAINRVLIFVLAGWGLGRVIMQFRRVFLVFLGLFILFNFLLVRAGLFTVTTSWDDIENVFHSIKQLIMSIGYIESFSILLGMWAGITGYQAGNEPKQVLSTD